MHPKNLPDHDPASLKIRALTHALDELTEALRITNLWNEEPSKIPSPEDFNSTVPFCLDTMPFEQWLQYVLIPKLREMISDVSEGSMIPEALLSLKVSVHPAAEEYWRGQWQEHRQVLLALRRLDEIFARGSGAGDKG